MNRALPVALGLVVIAVLAVEGKLGALWKAVTTLKSADTMQNVGSGSVNTSTLGTSQGNGSGITVPLPASLVDGATAGGMSIAALLAQRKYAVENGTDPVLNQYFYNHAATNDPVLNANWHSFINCYLQGGDTKGCADRWLPKS